VIASPEAPPLPKGTRNVIAVGLVVIALTLGGVGTWATLTPIAGAVIAPGAITVQSNRKTVQHLEGGIVAEILVRDGSAVERGEPLMRLDPTRVKASLMILEAELDLLRAREARLLAERDGEAELRFPAALEARGQDPNVHEMLRGQRRLFQARSKSLQGEVELRTQRGFQYEDEIAGLAQQILSKERQIEIVEDELEGLHALFDQGYMSKQRINELERLAEHLRGELGEHITSTARAENAISEANLQIIQLRNQSLESVVKELDEVQATLFDAHEQHVAALDRMSRLEVRAPQAGTVVGMSVHTVGGVIGAGEPLLDIVPAGDDLVVESHVRTEDIDKVRIGQTAIVRLSAFDLRTTPELRGTVINVSADSVVNEATGAAHYVVRSRIPERELEKLGELQLVPGMPAETFVQTGERTVLSYLVKPMSDALDHALRES
jgi:HlyD family type I secretion membrane fusion protein